MALVRLPPILPVMCPRSFQNLECQVRFAMICPQKSFSHRSLTSERPTALALAGAADAGSMAGSVLFFFMFFLGTSVFFVPLPGLGGLRRLETFRVVARLATGVVGAYYLYRGLILLSGGLAIL